MATIPATWALFPWYSGSSEGINQSLINVKLTITIYLGLSIIFRWEIFVFALGTIEE